MKDSFSYTTVGVVFGLLLVFGALWRTPPQSRATIRPRAPTRTPVLFSPASAATQQSMQLAIRGTPPSLAIAMSRAPAQPDKSKDDINDTVKLVLSEETASRLAHKAVDAMTNVTPGIVHLIVAETALSMTSGVTRVVFSAHNTTANVTIKLVATFDAGTLVYIRPYSSLDISDKVYDPTCLVNQFAALPTDPDLP